MRISGFHRTPVATVLGCLPNKDANWAPRTKPEGFRLLRRRPPGRRQITVFRPELSCR